MIKTAEDAYLAGRQAAMEKLASRAAARAARAFLRVGPRGAGVKALRRSAARAAVSPVPGNLEAFREAVRATPLRRGLIDGVNSTTYRTGRALGRVAGGLGVAGVGYGGYRAYQEYMKDRDRIERDYGEPSSAPGFEGGLPPVLEV